MKPVRNPVPQLASMFDGWLSPGVRVGNIVYTSGLVGWDLETGKILTTGTEAQVRRIFEGLGFILEAHGATLNDIVKMTMYFTDRKTQCPAFDKVRREIWKTDPPATTGVGVDQLEQDAQVEIEAIAVIPDV